MIFLKLGGSLITDKTGVEALRPDILARVVAEIQQARQIKPGLKLLVGHGAGSFGHVVAAKHGTRQGVASPAQWHGFAEVRAVTARLNRLVVEAFLAAGVPAIGSQPSASVVCENGRIMFMAIESLQSALQAGLIPVICGDVAFDTRLGGTIISTEEIMTYLVEGFRPSWLLLAGETAGVYDLQKKIVPTITAQSFPKIVSALGGSHGTDVTGGMATKVSDMLTLVENHPDLSIRIFSGLSPDQILNTLLFPKEAVGTVIVSDKVKR